MAGSADLIRTYRELLELDPRSLIFVMLAEELCTEGMWEEAVSVCKQGLVYHPDNLRARVLHGWALMELGEATESETVLIEIDREIRNNSIIYKLLSEFATFAGNPELAGEFSRIYQVFQTPQATGKDPGSPGLMESPECPEPEPPLAAIAGVQLEFDSASVPNEDDAKTIAVEPESPLTETAENFTRLEGILSRLADMLEYRLLEAKEPPSVLVEKDRESLKGAVLSKICRH